MTDEYVVTLRAPHPGQQRVLAGLKRFNHARMGRRWGKTSFGVDYLATDAGDRRGALHGMPVAWFAPTNKYLIDAWADAKHLLRPAIVRINEQYHRLEVLGGGRIEFWSLEKDDPARGRKYSKVVIDEAAIARKLFQKWHEAIRPTLTDYQGGALFASTPKGRNDFRKIEDYLRERAPDDSAFFHAPTSENPYIDPAEIAAAERETPSLVFRQEYLAEYVDAGGGILKPEWIQGGRPTFPWPIVLGVDLAISTKTTADWTVIVAMCRDPKTGWVYILGVRRFRAAFNAIIENIKAMADTFKPVAIGIEDNQFQAAVVQELLRTTKLPVRGVRRDKDKVTAFMPMAVRFERGMVRLDPELPGFYQDELLAFTGTPDDDHDDCVDATSTAFLMLPATSVSVASSNG